DTAQVLVPDGEAFPAEAGQDEQSRRPAPALALLEETVGAADVGAGEICAACPCGGGSGGEERGDVQLAVTGEGEAVRGAVERVALRSGADARDPAAGTEGGVVPARIGPGDADGGSCGIPRGEHDRDPGGQAEQVTSAVLGAADDLAELRGEMGQERRVDTGGVRDIG